MSIDLKISEPIEPVRVPEPSELEAIVKEIFFDECQKLGLDYNLYPSDPVNFILKTYTLISIYKLQRMREGDLSAFLPYASGESLNNLGALFNESRKEIGKDPSGLPVYDISDEQFRENIRTAFDDVSSGGSKKSYIKTAKSSPFGQYIEDVAPYAQRPEDGKPLEGRVNVPIIFYPKFYEEKKAEGLLDDDVQKQKEKALKIIQTYIVDRSPISDIVSVIEAKPIVYRVIATIKIKPGVSAGLVLSDARTSLLRYAEAQRKIGEDVTRNGIIAALFSGDKGRFNVLDVDLLEPKEDVITGEDEYPLLDRKTIENGAIVDDIEIKDRDKIREDDL